MKVIGERIRQRRKSLGWTVQKLATLSEVDNGFLSKLETGKASGSWETYTKIAGALGIPLEALVATQSNVIPAAPDWRTIPVLTHEQVASWHSSDGILRQHAVKETVMTDLEYAPSTFGLRLNDDSMEPEFKQGDLVVIASSVAPKPGDFVIATDAQREAHFRQYRLFGLNDRGEKVFELHPLNPIYPVMRSDRQAIVLVGTMVEHRRYRRR